MLKNLMAFIRQRFRKNLKIMKLRMQKRNLFYPMLMVEFDLLHGTKCPTSLRSRTY